MIVSRIFSITCERCEHKWRETTYIIWRLVAFASWCSGESFQDDFLPGDSKSKLRQMSSLYWNYILFRGCWFLYQLRQVSQIIQSAVNTSVLNLEQTRAQYIYIDDPRFKGNHPLSTTVYNCCVLIYIANTRNLQFTLHVLYIFSTGIIYWNMAYIYISMYKHWSILWFQIFSCLGRMRIYMDLHQRSQQVSVMLWRNGGRWKIIRLHINYCIWLNMGTKMNDIKLWLHLVLYHI